MASYQVEFAYAGVEDDEITLEIGDIINDCVQKEDGWLEGELNGKRGMFPDNFVKKINPTKAAKSGAPPPIPSHKPKPESLKKDKLFKAVFAYRASNGDELSFEEGAQITFLKEVEDGWAKGELSNGTIGLYPTNFVVAVPATGTGTELEAEKVEKKKETKKEAAEEIYKVAFDYAADNADELTLNTGDLIKILKKESADEGWWEGENMTSGSVGVFPKNFLEPAPVKAAVGGAAKAAIQQAPTGRTKTVVMRPKDAVDKQTRRNIVSEMPISSNMMDNGAVKNRPKGPNNRRPPKKKMPQERNPTSPLEENPPMEETAEIKTEIKPDPTPRSPTARSPMSGAVAMPGMNLNMASLKKKQAKMAATRSTEMRFEPPNGPGSGGKEPEEKSEIPPWKKELMMSKRGKSVKATSSTEKPAETTTPSWVKEIEKKKNSFNREDVKPEATRIKPEPVTPTASKPQPIAGTRTSFRPANSATASASSLGNSAVQSSATSSGAEPTLSDLLREIQGLKDQVQTLSVRLEDESRSRKLLESKVNSIQEKKH
jgi:hypothetical protein